MFLRHALLGAAMVAGCGGTSPTWTEAFDAGPKGWFLSAWGPSESDLYAVGGAPESGVVMHKDQAGWSEIEVGFDVPLLNWAYGFGPDDVTVVGAAGTVIHWDGTVWTEQMTPTDEDLWGVWGASANDLWAVGGRGREAGQATLLHYDGASWESVAIPVLQRPNVFAFFKVWGTGTNNVYVVGQRGVVLHYNGSSWQEELVGASDDLVSLWGTGPHEIVAIGGRSSGIMSIWDGASWRTESLSPTPGCNGIWMRTPGVAHVACAVGALLTVNTDTLVIDREEVPAFDDFHAIFSPASPQDDAASLLAVGGNILVSEPPFVGLAFERELGENE